MDIRLEGRFKILHIHPDLTHTLHRIGMKEHVMLSGNPNSSLIGWMVPNSLLVSMMEMSRMFFKRNEVDAMLSGFAADRW